jgi:hypothetical protein
VNKEFKVLRDLQAQLVQQEPTVRFLGLKGAREQLVQREQRARLARLARTRLCPVRLGVREPQDQRGRQEQQEKQEQQVQLVLPPLLLLLPVLNCKEQRIKAFPTE